jgi:16S rRNA C1402 (ribose-2'-O) methylase RsmI
MQNSIIKQQQDLINDLKEVIMENNFNLKKELSLTVDETITEKMNEFKDDFQKELEENNKLVYQTNDLLQKMQERKQTQEEQSHESFFSKIFHKNK